MSTTHAHTAVLRYCGTAVPARLPDTQLRRLPVDPRPRPAAARPSPAQKPSLPTSHECVQGVHLHEGAGGAAPLQGAALPARGARHHRQPGRQLHLQQHSRKQGNRQGRQEQPRQGSVAAKISAARKRSAALCSCALRCPALRCPALHCITHATLPCICVLPRTCAAPACLSVVMASALTGNTISTATSARPAARSMPRYSTSSPAHASPQPAGSNMKVGGW